MLKLIARHAWIPLVALYLFTASRHVTVPGLYYDEVFQNVSALAFIQSDFSVNPNWMPQTEVSLFGHRLPLMSMTYIGGLKTAAFAPVAAAAGVSAQSVRFFSIAVAALALFATFAFVRALVGPTTAAAAGLLVATDPSFIAFTRVDFGPSALMLAAKMTALWMLVRWWTGGRLRYLAAGCLLLGLGTWNKTDFIWVVAGIAGASVLVVPSALLRRLTRRSVLAALAGFAVGAGPFIWFNLRYPLASFDRSAFWIVSREPDASILERAWQRITVLVDLLSGAAFPAWQVPASAPVLPALLVLAIVAVGAHAAWTRGWREHRPFAFVLVSGVLTLLACAWMPGANAPHHVILAYPLPHIAVAYAAVLVGGRAGREGSRRTLQAAVVVLLLGAAAWTGLAQYRKGLASIERSGGSGVWSTAIHDLNDHLVSAAKDESVVAIDWGITIPILGLSGGIVPMYDMFDALGGATPEQAAGVLWPRFEGAGTRYVLHAAGATVFRNARANFLTAVDAQHRELVVDRTIAGRDGVPVFEVYRVGEPRPEGVSARPPSPDGPRSMVVAEPNPVPAGEGLGETRIAWDTGDGSVGQVYLKASWNGGGAPETLFSQAARGAQAAPWINAGATYEFRLYQGTEHKTLLATVVVRRRTGRAVQANPVK